MLIALAEFTESLLDIRSYLESTIRPTMVGPEKSFQTKGSYSALNAFSDWVLRVQYFIREPYLSHPESNMGPPWLSPEKNFQNQGSQKA